MVSLDFVIKLFKDTKSLVFAQVGLLFERIYNGLTSQGYEL